MLRGCGHNLFGNSIEGEGAKVSEQDFVIVLVLQNIVLQNLLLLRIVLEVFLQRLVTHNLLFEFKNTLVLHPFVGKGVENLLNSALQATHLVPNNRDAAE